VDSVRIRGAKPEDYDAAGELVVEAYRSLGDAGNDAYESALRDIGGRVEAGDVLVAELGGRIVGCVTVSFGSTALSQVEDPDAATIRMLGVSTNARGRGIGEALVRICIERARDRGCKRVRLDTRTSMKDAHRLYERLGFRRDPEHDWSPVEGILLLGYVLDL
jgi:ribosomal protein S18 acetylase RimI-like enzyme